MGYLPQMLDSKGDVDKNKDTFSACAQLALNELHRAEALHPNEEDLYNERGAEVWGCENNAPIGRSMLMSCTGDLKNVRAQPPTHTPAPRPPPTPSPPALRFLARTGSTRARSSPASSPTSTSTASSRKAAAASCASSGPLTMLPRCRHHPPTHPPLRPLPI